MPPPPYVVDRIEQAIDALLQRDAFLLENTTGERTIAARLACYMVPLFDGYDVDVEYNRQGVVPGDSKDLPGILLTDCEAGRKALEAGKDTVTVFPDIIVHHRGGIGAKHNLLVVEIKRETNAEPRECDHAKIDAMMLVYKYQFGLCLDIPSGPGASHRQAKLRWFG